MSAHHHKYCISEGAIFRAVCEEVEGGNHPLQVGSVCRAGASGCHLIEKSISLPLEQLSTWLSLTSTESAPAENHPFFKYDDNKK